MLGKLIKHEFRATGRILLPVYLVMLLPAALVPAGAARLALRPPLLTASLPALAAYAARVL